MDAPPSSSSGDGTLVEAALRILNAEDPWVKASLGEATAKQWFDGAISRPYDPSVDLPVPDRPARLSNVSRCPYPLACFSPSSTSFLCFCWWGQVKLVAPSLMPKLGKAGSLQSRQAILHSLAHTESWAIDLSWDIIARFGKEEAMPRPFFDDFVKVAQDEGRHFTLLSGRLQELGSFYGALPAHDGLWDSAIQTSNSLLARLAVEHCVHEARGLDVLPTTISRFRNGGDDATADLLETVVYPEEVTHCAAGVKWFKYLCQRMQQGSPQDKDVQEDKKLQAPDQLSAATNENSEANLKNSGEQKDESEARDDGHLDPVIDTFHAIVRTHFRGPLKPPFNEQARQAAGFGPEWYKPLAVKEFGPAE